MPKYGNPFSSKRRNVDGLILSHPRNSGLVISAVMGSFLPHLVMQQFHGIMLPQMVNHGKRVAQFARPPECFLVCQGQPGKSVWYQPSRLERGLVHSCVRLSFSVDGSWRVGLSKGDYFISVTRSHLGNGKSRDKGGGGVGPDRGRKTAPGTACQTAPGHDRGCLDLAIGYGHGCALTGRPYWSIPTPKP